MSKHLSYQRAHDLFEYEPAAGLLTRRVTTSSNARGGDVAGSSNGRGYLTVRIDGNKYVAHRIAWLLMTGEWPDFEIDHINGVPSRQQVRPNLRASSHVREHEESEDSTNNNTSRCKGVTWDKARQKWQTKICCNGIQYHLGRHTDLEIANAYYAGAAAILFGQWQRGELK